MLLTTYMAYVLQFSDIFNLLFFLLSCCHNIETYISKALVKLTFVSIRKFIPLCCILCNITTEKQLLKREICISEFVKETKQHNRSSSTSKRRQNSKKPCQSLSEVKAILNAFTKLWVSSIRLNSQ